MTGEIIHGTLDCHRIDRLTEMTNVPRKVAAACMCWHTEIKAS